MLLLITRSTVSHFGDRSQFITCHESDIHFMIFMISDDFEMAPDCQMSVGPMNFVVIGHSSSDLIWVIYFMIFLRYIIMIDVSDDFEMAPDCKTKMSVGPVNVLGGTGIWFGWLDIVRSLSDLLRVLVHCILYAI